MIEIPASSGTPSMNFECFGPQVDPHQSPIIRITWQVHQIMNFDTNRKTGFSSSQQGIRLVNQ